jgi:hypothetical protein
MYLIYWIFNLLVFILAYIYETKSKNPIMEFFLSNCRLNRKLEAQVSLYRSPDINKSS